MATIIIVDDSAAIREQVKKALDGKGYNIVEGVDGVDGLAKIMEIKTPDLVISDINMPGMDGVAMLTKAKELLGGVKFPIFVLTTETSDSLKTSGKAVGVLAWINKPCDGPKLLSAVEKVLARK
jgi:two-component system, chemotaxis family, chemotaxis protein CheY